MRTIQNQTFDEERALYGSDGIMVKDCSFDGPADGESAFKECRNVQVERSFFNLRYPFWHDHGLSIRNCEMTELCRAALWYSDHVTIENSKLYGIKALRGMQEYCRTRMQYHFPGVWLVNAGRQDGGVCCRERIFHDAFRRLQFYDVRMKGKYSFQYIEDAIFENCIFDTKDAFWHAKNITVRNSVIKGELSGVVQRGCYF